MDDIAELKRQLALDEALLNVLDALGFVAQFNLSLCREQTLPWKYGR